MSGLNLAARLARLAMVGAWRSSPRSTLVLGLVVFTVWFGSGAWVAWDAVLALPTWPGWWRVLGDLIYAPMTFLFPATNFVFAETLSWQVQVARFSGLLFSALNLIWLTRRRVLTTVARGLIPYGQGYAVLKASNGSADVLAITSSVAGQTVVLVDDSVAGDAVRAERLGESGVIWLPGGDRTLALWRKTGFDAAETIAVWEAGDAQTLASAFELRPLLSGREREILLSVTNPATQRALRHAPDLLKDGLVRFRPVSVTGAAMRSALANADLVEAASGSGQPCVSVCLWGDGPSLSWAAELVLRQNWSIHLSAPRLLLGTPTAGHSSALATESTLQNFAKFASQVFMPQKLPEIASVSETEVGSHTSITRHIIDFGDDDATLAFAFRLAASLRQAQKAPVPVQTVLHAAPAVGALFASTTLNLLPPIDAGEATTIEALLTRSQDEIAAGLHLDYARKFGGVGVPLSGRWQDLAETYISANRAAADHQAVKAWDAVRSGCSGADLHEALAETEHDRWCAERLLDGWIPAATGERDTLRRIHPDLAPWASLDELTREKDRSQVKGWFEGRFAVSGR